MIKLNLCRLMTEISLNLERWALLRLNIWGKVNTLKRTILLWTVFYALWYFFIYCQGPAGLWCVCGGCKEASGCGGIRNAGARVGEEKGPG